MYSILNIKREEKEQRKEQFKKNFELFGAPVGIFIYIDRSMGYPQWSDVRIFIQSVLLLALKIIYSHVPKNLGHHFMIW